MPSTWKITHVSQPDDDTFQHMLLSMCGRLGCHFQTGLHHWQLLKKTSGSGWSHVVKKDNKLTTWAKSFSWQQGKIEKEKEFNCRQVDLQSRGRNTWESIAEVGGQLPHKGCGEFKQINSCGKMKQRWLNCQANNFVSPPAIISSYLLQIPTELPQSRSEELELWAEQGLG